MKPLDFEITCSGCGKFFRLHCMDTDWQPIACPALCGTYYGLSRGTGREYKMILLEGAGVVRNEVHIQARYASSDYLKRLTDEARAEAGE